MVFGILLKPLAARPNFQGRSFRKCTIQMLGGSSSALKMYLRTFGWIRKIGDLGGASKYFFAFHPETWGKIPNLTHVFRMGWFNHQPVINAKVWMAS